MISPSALHSLALPRAMRLRFNVPQGSTMVSNPHCPTSSIPIYTDANLEQNDEIKARVARRSSLTLTLRWRQRKQPRLRRGIFQVNVLHKFRSSRRPVQQTRSKNKAATYQWLRFGFQATLK